MKTVPAAKFKANCLALMDEVHAKREPILVTKKGKPTVKLVPPDEDDDSLAVFRFPGIQTTGDVLSPAFDPDEWEMLR